MALRSNKYIVYLVAHASRACEKVILETEER